MVREQHAARPELGERTREPDEQRRIVDVRRLAAQRRIHLSQRRTAEPRPPAPEVDEQERRLTCAEVELRRERRAHVAHARKRGNHQRNRRYHELFPAVPHRSHAERVFAYRHADAERRAQFHADGVDRVEQRGVFTRVPGCCHPIRRQLHVRERGDRRGEQVRDRFTHREPRRRGRREQRNRRALTERHGFTGVPLVVEQGDRRVRDRHLMAPDHLIARDEAAHGAIADGDQKLLRSHAREAQHA